MIKGHSALKFCHGQHWESIKKIPCKCPLDSLEELVENLVTEEDSLSRARAYSYQPLKNTY